MLVAWKLTAFSRQREVSGKMFSALIISYVWQVLRRARALFSFIVIIKLQKDCHCLTLVDVPAKSVIQQLSY